MRTLVDDAMEIIPEIQKLSMVQQEIKRAFARAEIEGGATAAFTHPLYLECESRLEVLRDQLRMVI
ncbi:hypothetical protein SEA_MARCIE_17 [Microbacterium phage Marcie]|nr:hypothetical protein SEA_MARCIE_17 [Microbacterium phage Marcie]